MDDLVFDPAALDQLGPADRRRAEQLLKEHADVLRKNPLHRFRSHAKQQAFLSAQEWMRLFIGGNRSGKTTAGVIADIIDLVDRDVVPEHLQMFKRWEPPVAMRFVGVDARQIEKIQEQTFKAWIPPEQLVGGRWDRAYDKKSATLSLKNGSWIDFLTQNMDVEAFQSIALHRVHFDEEPPYDHGQSIFAECLERLRDYVGDCLFTMTPLHGMSWLYEAIYLPWARALGEEADIGSVDGTFIVRVDRDENPYLNAESEKRATTKLTSVEEQQARKSGRFVSFAGRVFSEFTSQKHVVPEFENLHDVVRELTVEGIDPGIRFQAAGIWFFQDPDGVVTVFDSLAISDLNIPHVAEEIQRVRARWEISPDWSMIDPAARGRAQQTGVTDLSEYHRCGVWATPANNDVAASINRIRALIHTDKLRVTANNVMFIEQMLKYRWTKQKRSEHSAPEKPVKRDDHLVDAFRYAIMSLPWDEPSEGESLSSQQLRLRRDYEKQIAGKVAAAHDDPEFGPGLWD